MLADGNRKVISRRFKVYFDNKPRTAIDSEKRICLNLKSSGQIIRLSEDEAYDLVAELAKALKWGHNRKFH
jgi:hypothetical protein